MLISLEQNTSQSAVPPRDAMLRGVRNGLSGGRLRAALRDPRCWQIASLTGLLVYGLVALDFDQAASTVLATIAAGLVTQALFTWWLRLPRFDPLSPLITALSLSILLRTSAPWLMALAAAFAMACKFLVRVDGKHVFNPSNIAIVALIATGQAWVSPAQWGSQAWGVFLMACFAGLVLSRAKRADIALAFLGSYAVLLLARALYLGDPWTIPLKQLQSGALLLFAFFMISDPKATPDRRVTRIVFAMAVAIAGFVLQLGLYKPEGLMIALAALSPLVPLLDRWRPLPPAQRFQWSNPTV
jgi:Na+-transporting NADH:ubiquinone oxidoreductase subunit NqrB